MPSALARRGDLLGENQRVAGHVEGLGGDDARGLMIFVIFADYVVWQPREDHFRPRQPNESHDLFERLAVSPDFERMQNVTTWVSEPFFRNQALVMPYEASDCRASISRTSASALALLPDRLRCRRSFHVSCTRPPHVCALARWLRQIGGNFDVIVGMADHEQDVHLVAAVGLRDCSGACDCAHSRIREDRRTEQ